MKVFFKTIVSFIFVLLSTHTFGFVAGDGQSPAMFNWQSALPTEPKMFTPVKVDETGQASFSFPIEYPDVYSKLPISLSYNSRSGADKEMAYGWQISGLLEIRRPVSRRFLEDEWVITGPISGVIQKNSAGDYVIFKKGAGADKITFNNFANTWTIDDHQGNTWTLEARDNGHTTSAGTALWRVKTLEDTNGNTTEFSYHPTNHTLLTVDIGAHPATGKQAQVRLAFRYTGRTNPWSDFSKGFEDSYKQLLDSIDVMTLLGSGYNVIRQYSFNYESSEANMPLANWEIPGSSSKNVGHVLLTKINTLNFDNATGRSAYGEEINFDYSERRPYGPATTNFIKSATGCMDHWIGVSGPSAWGNGCAISDIRSSTSVSTIIASGGVTGVGNYVEQHGMLVDLNGDGLLDLAKQGSTGSTLDVAFLEYDPHTHRFEYNSVTPVHKGAGGDMPLNQWFTAGVTFPKTHQYIKTADLDGDGLTDIISAYEEDYHAHGVRNNPSQRWGVYYGQQPYGFSSAVIYEDSPVQSMERKDKGHGYIGQLTRTMIDMNQDGWLDIVQIDLTGVQQDIEVYYHKGSRGAGWKKSSDLLHAPWRHDMTLPPTVLSTTGSLGDNVNLDVCQNVGTPNKLCYNLVSIGVTGLRDINGDGLLDYIVANPSWVNQPASYYGTIEVFNLENTQTTQDHQIDDSFHIADFEKTDRWIVYYNNGHNGWEPARSWNVQDRQTFLSYNFNGRPKVNHRDPLYQHSLSDIVDIDGDKKADIFLNDRYDQVSRYGTASLILNSPYSAEWAPNILDGHAMQKGVPYAFQSSSLSTAIVEDIPMGSGGTDLNVTRSAQAVVDLNNDGILDYVNANDDVIHWGDYWGKPNLMVTIRRHNQAETTISYQPSSQIYPSGDISSSDTTNIANDVVSRVKSVDQITHETADYIYDYENPMVQDQIFYGFETTRTKGATYHGASMFDWDFEIEKVFFKKRLFGTAMKESTYKIDPCLTFAPSVSTGCKTAPTHPINFSTVFYKYKGSDANLMVPFKITKTQYGEYSTLSSRTLETEITHNNEGFPTLVTQDGGDGYSNDVNDKMTVYNYKQSSDKVVQKIESVANWGFDPINSTWRQLARLKYDYDANWNIFEKVIYSGYYDGGQAITDDQMKWSFSRGPRGEIQSSFDHQLSSNTSYTYTFGDTKIDTETNTYGHTIHHTYDDQGRILTSTDANGVRGRMVYHPLGHIEASYIRDSLGNEFLDKETHFNIPSPGIMSPIYKELKTYDEHGQIMVHNYEIMSGYGSVVQTWTQSKMGDFMVQDKKINLLGQTLEISRPYTRSVFNPTSGPGATQIQTRAFYDPFGNVRENIKDVAASFNSEILFKPNVGEMRNIDEDGYINLKQENIYGLPVAIFQGQGSQMDMMANYIYDATGRLVKFIDANGFDNLYHYDAAGRLRKAVGSDFGTREYEYLNHKVTLFKDSAGGAVTKSYDALGRIDKITVSDPLAPGSAIDTIFTYDTAWIGKLSTVTDSQGDKTFYYDSLGRLTKENRKFRDGTGAVLYNINRERTLNIQGMITEQIKPSGKRFEYIYQNGWLDRVKEPSENLDLVNLYHPVYSGKSVGWSAYQYGIITHRFEQAYIASALYPDSDTLSLYQPSFPGGKKEIRKTYGWKQNGLLDQTQLISNYGFQYAKSYEYDHLRRLMGVNASAGSFSQNETFTYRDAAGNVNTLTDPFGDQWNYGPIKGVGALPTGNLFEKRTHMASSNNEYLTYDLAGRLSYYEDPAMGLKFKYLYYGDGRLRAVQDDSGSTPVTLVAYQYDHTGKVIVKAYGDPYGPAPRYYTEFGWVFDERTGETKEHVSVNGKPVLQYVNGNRIWTFNDYTGSVEATFDDWGSSIRQSEFSAYGQTLGTPQPAVNERAFHGMAFDEVSHLYEAGVRHMNSRLGIFLQPEPILYSGDLKSLINDPAKLNAHRYAGNSPTSFSDVTGNASTSYHLNNVNGWSVMSGSWAEVTHYQFAGGSEQTVIPTYALRFSQGLQGWAVDTDNVAGSAFLMSGANYFNNIHQALQPDLSGVGVMAAMAGGPIGNKISGTVRGAIKGTIRSVDPKMVTNALEAVWAKMDGDKLVIEIGKISSKVRDAYWAGNDVPSDELFDAMLDITSRFDKIASEKLGIPVAKLKEYPVFHNIIGSTPSAGNTKIMDLDENIEMTEKLGKILKEEFDALKKQYPDVADQIPDMSDFE